MKSSLSLTSAVICMLMQLALVNALTILPCSFLEDNTDHGKQKVSDPEGVVFQYCSWTNVSVIFAPVSTPLIKFHSVKVKGGSIAFRTANAGSKLAIEVIECEATGMAHAFSVLTKRVVGVSIIVRFSKLRGKKSAGEFFQANYLSGTEVDTSGSDVALDLEKVNGVYSKVIKGPFKFHTDHHVTRSGPIDPPNRKDRTS